MKANILDPKWKYHDATSHRTSSAFKRRQDQRRKDAQKEPPPAPPPAIAINTKRKRTA